MSAGVGMVALVAGAGCAAPGPDVSVADEALMESVSLDTRSIPAVTSYLGRGSITVEGHTFPLRGRLRLRDAAADRELVELVLDGDDTTFTVRLGPIVLRRQSVVGAHAEMVGEPAWLTWASPGAWTLASPLRVAARAHARRDGSGVLRDPLVAWEGSTTAMSVVETPSGMRVTGSLAVTYDGDTYPVSYVLDAVVSNHAPTVTSGVASAADQDVVCPLGVNKEPGVLDMTGPDGWTGTLGASTWDPDGEGATDLQMRVVETSGLADLTFGATFVPITLPEGEYREVVTVSDVAGALARSTCAFRVSDVSPPQVTAPTDLVAECTSALGVARDEALVASWLASATASDLVDGIALVRDDLGPQAPRGSTLVRFEAADTHGNVGAGFATLEVHDTAAPSIEGSATAMSLGGGWSQVLLTAGASDACGSATWVLESVSADPWVTVYDAVTGIADTDLYTWALEPGLVILKLRGTDDAGNSTIRKVLVLVPGAWS